jgi:hypothetical protein
MTGRSSTGESERFHQGHGKMATCVTLMYSRVVTRHRTTLRLPVIRSVTYPQSVIAKL